MKLASVAYFLATIAAVSVIDASEPSSYFRSNYGCAVGDSVPLPADFASKTNLLWRTPLTPGNSTPSVSDDSIFLTTWQEESKELATVALDRKTNRRINLRAGLAAQFDRSPVVRLR